jgi:hypothetical protein
MAEQVAILAGLLLMAGDDVVDTWQRLLSFGGRAEHSNEKGGRQQSS